MEARTNYFIYARKSTKGDERQALSIPAQLNVLRQLAAQQNIRIVDTIVERESAHAPGRPEFGEMLKRIKAGEASGIIAWHPDRLARNSKDGGEIVYLLDVGVLIDLKFSTFWFENTPQGKSNLGHEFVQTKQFSDKLSYDTKRGLEAKAQMGIYPCIAPIGYLNDRLAKTIVLDPQLGPVIRGAFELFAVGNVNQRDLQIYFAKHGVLSKPSKRLNSEGGNPIHLDYIRRILRNPFYYGCFYYSGEFYEGTHDPIITKTLFDEVQNVLARRTHRARPDREPKAFVGLFRCGECNMMITAEIHKGHTYYRCTKKSKTVVCSQPYVREEVLENDLSQMLKKYCLRKEWADELLRLAEVAAQEEAHSARATVRERKAEAASISGKIQKLLETYIEGLIDRLTFSTHKQNLLNQKKQVEEKIVVLERDGNAWLEPYKTWVLDLKSTAKIACTGSSQEKKGLAQKVFGSTLTLVGKKPFAQAVEPWSLIPQVHGFPTMVRLHASARTHFAENCKNNANPRVSPPPSPQRGGVSMSKYPCVTRESNIF